MGTLFGSMMRGFATDDSSGWFSFQASFLSFPAEHIPAHQACPERKDGGNERGSIPPPLNAAESRPQE